MLQLLFMCLLFGHYSAVANPQSRIDLVVGNYPPYIDQESKQLGVITQLVQQSLQLAKIETNVEFDQWPNINDRINSEKILSFMWTVSAERQRAWLFSVPIYKSQVGLVANKEAKLQWQRYDQLRDYDIGLTRGFSYGKLFDDYKQYLNYRESISEYVSLKNLIARKYDAVVIERLMAQHLLSYFSARQQNSVEFVYQPVIETKNYYLVCAKSYSKCYSYIEAFNQGFRKLKQLDTYHQLITNSVNKK